MTTTAPIEPRCPRCLEDHPIFRCPYVKAIDLEYGGDLTSIKRVEFLTPADYGRPTPGTTAAGPGADYPRKGAA